VSDREPRLYRELAAWWPLLSPPEEYLETATFYRELLEAACAAPPRTLLELGSGGGNHALHLKTHLALTLVDRSPEMLAVSRALNPECEHIEGDMRSIRLDHTFDAVFVHDAVAYLTSEDELADTMATAAIHCRPGGATVFVPDFVRETFFEGTDHGGHDGPDRAMRYLEWRHDPIRIDTTYLVDFAFLLRLPSGALDVRRDRHVCGLFPRQTWLDLLEQAGFEARVHALAHGEPVGPEAFVGRRRQ
jgi:SAM-dependent methyltransferase